MEILSVNIDQKLMGIASSIGRSPESWNGWYCLHIDVKGANNDHYQDCMLWTKSIVESYLKDMEGCVYLSGGKTIHIFAKTAQPYVLQQAGQQIHDLLYAESSIMAHCTIYNLAQDGTFYAQGVLEQMDNIFSLPVSQQAKPKQLPLPETIAQQKTTAVPLKVLLIEDDPVTRWMVRSTLKNECEFVTAPTMNKAFSMYTSYQPDLVFLDINLPDGDGYSVLEWVMRHDPGACVVMFSSEDSLDNILKALDCGASGFVAKPFLTENLLHYIHN